MKLTAIGALALLLQSASAQSQHPQGNRTAAVEGIITRAGSGEPLANAQVTLIATSAAAAAFGPDLAADRHPARVALPPATSDRNGRFAFANVPAGTYRISVARNGYVRQEYGQRVFGGQGRTITVATGQEIRDVAVQLVPAGNLSGVVRDPSGEPIPGAQVQLLRFTYNQAGARTFQVAGGDRSNDRGEYRVYWVTPGRYYVIVNADAAARGAALVAGSGSPNETVGRPYPTTFYPGTTDSAQASILEISPGAEMSVDVAVPEHDVFHVTGRVVDSRTGQPPTSAAISIVRRGQAGMPLSLAGAAASYNAADGTFDISEVPAGLYWVRAIASGDSASALVPKAAAGRTVADFFADAVFLDRQTAQLPVDVGSDVDGVVLSLGGGVSIQGWLSLDDQPLPVIGDPGRLQVTLRPAVSGMLVNPLRGRPPSHDGAFTVENVLPGEYFVAVQPMPPDYYVKDAHIGDIDVLERPLRVSGAASAVLNVVLSGKGGQIDGTIFDSTRQPVAGIQAVLVPDVQRDRADLFRTATTDRSGHFSLRGIAPGDYKVFAWEAIESFGYFDPEFVRRFEHLGQPARIAPRSKVVTDVTVIPAAVP
jgi:hypothetical protein